MSDKRTVHHFEFYDTEVTITERPFYGELDGDITIDSDSYKMEADLVGRPNGEQTLILTFGDTHLRVKGREDIYKALKDLIERYEKNWDIRSLSEKASEQE